MNVNYILVLKKEIVLNASINRLFNNSNILQFFFVPKKKNKE